MRSLVAALLLVGLAGCDDPGVTLRLRVRSDLTPGATLGRVEVDLPELPASSRTTHVFWPDLLPNSELLSPGVLALERSGLPPSSARRVSVRGYDLGGAPILEREVLVDNRGPFEMTLVLTSNCREVDCSAEAAESGCLDGACVPADCIDGSEESCPPDLACASDAACTAGSACAAGRCVQGVCLYEAQDERCAAEEICDAALGCLPQLLDEGDLDGDGIVDIFDEDDDGDGIGDLEECFPGLTGGQLVNGSFEEVSPPVTGTASMRPDDTVAGWSSTEGVIELWGDGFTGVPSAHGEVFVEMCAAAQSGAFTQSITTIPGTTLRWGLYHRLRTGTEERLDIQLGPVGATELQRSVIAIAAWTFHTGVYRVPPGQEETLLELRYSTSTDCGNFLDGVVLEPVCTRDTDRDGLVDSRDPD